MCLVLVYGLMKIRSEYGHHQNTLGGVTTTAKPRENPSFNSETPREGCWASVLVSQNRNTERLVTEVVRIEASL